MEKRNKMPVYQTVSLRYQGYVSPLLLLYFQWLAKILVMG